MHTDIRTLLQLIVKPKWIPSTDRSAIGREVILLQDHKHVASQSKDKIATLARTRSTTGEQEMVAVCLGGRKGFGGLLIFIKGLIRFLSLCSYRSLIFKKCTKNHNEIQFFTYQISKNANESGMKTLVSIWWNDPIIAAGRVNWCDLSGQQCIKYVWRDLRNLISSKQ